jgi:hypothetical protein
VTGAVGQGNEEPMAARRAGREVARFRGKVAFGPPMSTNVNMGGRRIGGEGARTVAGAVMADVFRLEKILGILAYIRLKIN